MKHLKSTLLLLLFSCALFGQNVTFQRSGSSVIITEGTSKFVYNGPASVKGIVEYGEDYVQIRELNQSKGVIYLFDNITLINGVAKPGTLDSTVVKLGTEVFHSSSSGGSAGTSSGDSLLYRTILDIGNFETHIKQTAIPQGGSYTIATNSCYSFYIVPQNASSFEVTIGGDNIAYSDVFPFPTFHNVGRKKVAEEIVIDAIVKPLIVVEIY